MKESRYIGGSKVRSFRLPLDGYTSAVAKVQALLHEIANEMKETHGKGTKSMAASAKTTLANKAQSKSKDSITYECGCSYEAGIFRRSSGCKIERGKHRMK